jgi:protein TonB
MVIISFIVEKDGKITNITVLREPGAGTGDEAAASCRLCPTGNPASKTDNLQGSECNSRSLSGLTGKLPGQSV